MTNSWEHQIEPIAYKALNYMLGDNEKDWFTYYHGSAWKIIRENTTEDAIVKIRKLVNENGIDHFHPAILNQHSSTLLDLGRINDAIELRRLNVEFYPKIFQLYNFLAEAYIENGDLQNAKTAYEKSIELKPENNPAVKQLKRLNIR